MSYVVTLYREGGEDDGYTYACGPFDLEDANRAADTLADYGSASVMPLAESADEVESVLR